MTLRVPDDATNYALPPGLGTFPLVKAQNYASSIPDYIAQRAGYIMPLFQREAMWMGISPVDLHTECDINTCAIKISVGGINAITGSKQDEAPPKGVQDYVVGGKQPWLDGIATEPGVIRQFVAMPLGQGYTIEEQLTNTAAGGIQIDVFPSLSGVVTFRHNGQEVTLDKSPSSLNIQPGEVLLMESVCIKSLDMLRDVVRFVTPNPILNISYRELPPLPKPGSSSIRISVENVKRGVFHFIVERSYTIGQVKSLIEIMDCIPLSDQQLILGSMILENEKALSDYEIQGESRLYLIVRPSMQIFVNIMSEDTLALVADPFDTVHMIMLNIQVKTGVPPVHQRLSFRGNTLEHRKAIKGQGNNL
ncbi:hypothetical protein DL96DRAFT_541780 [Flagelloscypha sp. PMI_526]|nr:hypothetical protein DL96DRAFT_541780 [Flagelloscypha sp. PMI_526]